MNNRIMRRRIGATASWAALGLALAVSGQAFAQTGQNTGTTAPGGDQEVSPDGSNNPAELQTGDNIIVVGTRQSQQSAIDRKRNARTATDSIVADDIGSFPDRNVNEAISRVPGVALSRNEFGEGDGVSLRGNGPDLTRVELDGAGVQRSDPSINTGRGADMRELPAELVKSIDVVKGATADQTEGGLGGSILIKTRSGLDFKKPYFSIRAGAQQNSLTNDWTPDFNAVATKKFFDDRLGVIVSGTYSRVQNNSSIYENTTSNAADYARQYDFDNSPNKTFQFNPATVGTDAADVAFANSRQESDGSALTPRELINLSAGATSKAQCYQLFPVLTTGFGAGIGTTSAAASTRSAQVTQRIREQQTCLNQWNDNLPSLIRNINDLQDEQRYSVDARIDYRVTDNLTVYAKAQVNGRKVDDQLRYRSPIPLPGTTGSNTAGTFIDVARAGGGNNRTVNPAGTAGYYLFDQQYSVFPVNSGSGATLVTTPTFGNVLNIVPGSVQVDANHNVTSIQFTNATVGYDQISNTIDSKSRYYMLGAEWRLDRLLVEGFGAKTSTSASRYDFRTGRNQFVGTASMTVQDNGLWNIDTGTVDPYNAASFVTLNPPACVAGTNQNPATCVGQAAAAATAANPSGTTQYLVSQLPLVTPSGSMQYSPRIGETTEKQAKLDITYDTDGLLPFVKRVKVGAMYRNNTQYQWSGGGRTIKAAVGTYGTAGYIPAVVTPSSTLRGTYRACQPTATSTLGCNYGFVASQDPAANRQGVYTFTPAELQALYTQVLRPQEMTYFGDLPNRGTLPNAWPEMDVDAFYAATGIPNLNFDCVKTCTANDGKVYAQPFTGADETIKNVYGMFDFEQRLPLGLLFNGNMGVRGVFTSTKGQGLQTFALVQYSNPADRTSTSYTQNLSLDVSIQKNTTDWLPTFNANLWAFDEQVVLRAYGGKTVARPSIGNLIPGGTCTIDAFDAAAAGDDTFGCSGRVGNPGLKPFTAWNYNLALEWYANADTLFSVAYGKLDVKIGSPEAITIVSQPFAGSTAVDPVTGSPLANLTFSVPTWRNGPGYKRDIWEFNIKHAFTYLPWALKHLGMDANVSLLSSTTAIGGTRDPNTGDVMKPAGESRYYLNGSIWYDDGKLNLRATMQKRAEQFSCITPCTSNVISFNYPGTNYTNIATSPQGYNPGAPKFIDATTYIDAKASYNITRNFQIYVEGRNMTRESQTESEGSYQLFSDGTPKIIRLRYGGRRILAGVRAQFGN